MKFVFMGTVLRDTIFFENWIISPRDVRKCKKSLRFSCFFGRLGNN